MNIKRSFRTLVMLLLIGLVVFGLASCRLPASKGPAVDLATSEGFPVPGETQQAPATSSGIIPTSQVVLPVVVAPGQATPVQNPAYPNPVATNSNVEPVATAGPITYIEPTPGGPPESYTLQEGEYPFCIARRFDVNQNELLSLNNLTAESFFYAGQELKIPQTGDPFDGARTLHEHPSTYKIKDGDTLYSIACYFGDVSPDMIALQNTLSTYDLPVGEVLVIP